MRNSVTVEVTLAANTDRDIQRPGRAWVIKSSSHPLDVTERFRGSEVGKSTDVEQGMGFPGSDDEKGFHSLVLHSSVTQTVEVVISDRPMIMQRLSGVVSVVDGGRQRTKDGVAFSGTATQGSVTAEYAHVQLLNPAGSGVEVVLNQILFSVANTGLVCIRPHSTALGTLIGNAVNKYIGGASSSAEIRTESNASQLGGTNMGLFDTAGTEYGIYQFTEPVIIEPGKGILCGRQVTAAALRATFEFYERGI